MYHKTEEKMTELRDGDYMKQVIAYIEKNMGRGYNIDQIRFTLMQHGYSRAAIERGIRVYNQTHPPKPEVKMEAPPMIVEEPKVEPVAEKRGFFSKVFGFFAKEDKPEPAMVQ